jgi:oligopeptide transport system ATP-binding protein
MTEPILQARDVRVRFGAQLAVKNASFDLFAGETLGLVGESGSGKSTLARAVLRLVKAEGGEVWWHGRNLLLCDSQSLRPLRRDLQIVFQNPLASLSPRMTVGAIIAEPLHIFAAALSESEHRKRVADMLDRVGLDASMARRYPHEFSGGQCQRIGIARAMIMDPQVLICDEAVSSLDVSVQGQIVNLLLDLQRDVGTAMLFISHNLAVVRHVSHRVTVMFAGALVETTSRGQLFTTPLHPYTRALLAAVPSPVPGARVAMSSESTESASVGGCAYRGRCPYAIDICSTVVPRLEQAVPDHWVACHRAKEFPLSLTA